MFHLKVLLNNWSNGKSLHGNIHWAHLIRKIQGAKQMSCLYCMLTELCYCNTGSKTWVKHKLAKCDSFLPRCFKIVTVVVQVSWNSFLKYEVFREIYNLAFRAWESRGFGQPTTFQCVEFQHSSWWGRGCVRVTEIDRLCSWHMQ